MEEKKTHGLYSNISYYLDVPNIVLEKSMDSSQ
jgi:hypothetical protein